MAPFSLSDMKVGVVPFNYMGVILFKGHPTVAYLRLLADRILTHFDSWNEMLLSFARNDCLIIG